MDSVPFTTAAGATSSALVVRFTDPEVAAGEMGYDRPLSMRIFTKDPVNLEIYGPHSIP